MSANWKILSKQLQSKKLQGSREMDILNQVLSNNKNEAPELDTRVGKYVAMDCEMVGVGPEGARSILARVSIVNYHGAVLLDEFVKPTEPVTDYRTKITGVNQDILKNGKDFNVVRKQVAEIIKDKIIVGHALSNDFDVLNLHHPRHLIRDSAKHKPFKKNNRPRALRHLVKEHLGLVIQEGTHSSVEDARTCMMLFHRYKHEWKK